MYAATFVTIFGFILKLIYLNLKVGLHLFKRTNLSTIKNSLGFLRTLYI